MNFKLITGATWLSAMLSGAHTSSACEDPGMTFDLPLINMVILPTEGDLPQESQNYVRQASNAFFFAELSQAYASSHSVYSVNTSVVTDLNKKDVEKIIRKDKLVAKEASKQVGGVRPEARVPISGSQFLMNIEVVLGCDPSLPSRDDMTEQVQIILEDLSYFVMNLTSTGDPSLSAIRFAIAEDLTLAPSSMPSASPVPSEKPSNAPSISQAPSTMPSISPSKSSIPSAMPSHEPSLSQVPSTTPSLSPTASVAPSGMPSESPSQSQVPSTVPSDSPSHSVEPSGRPSTAPSISQMPSALPSHSPSTSAAPSGMPSDTPSISAEPSGAPSFSLEPSSIPSDSPSISLQPSSIPSSVPSESQVPTLSPSRSPSASLLPSSMPSVQPSTSAAPSSVPSDRPTFSQKPSLMPSVSPSALPSALPSDTPSVSQVPSNLPTGSPSASVLPSTIPSDEPSVTQVPTSMPSSEPSLSLIPSKVPSSKPSYAPSLSQIPSTIPSDTPSSFPSVGPREFSTTEVVSIGTALSGETMNDETVRVFESTSRQFIMENLPPNDIYSINVTGVSVLGQEYDSQQRRVQAAEELKIGIKVIGEVTPGNPPDSFSFADAVGHGFATNFTGFVTMLRASSSFFREPSSPNSIQDRDTNLGSNEGSFDPFDLSLLAYIAIAAVAVVLVVSAFAIWRKTRRARSMGTSQGGDIPSDAISSADSTDSISLNKQSAVRPASAETT